jgi:hypothetical protein
MKKILLITLLFTACKEGIKKESTLGVIESRGSMYFNVNKQKIDSIIKNKNVDTAINPIMIVSKHIVNPFYFYRCQLHLYCMASYSHQANASGGGAALAWVIIYLLNPILQKTLLCKCN